MCFFCYHRGMSGTTPESWRGLLTLPPVRCTVLFHWWRLRPKLQRAFFLLSFYDVWFICILPHASHHSQSTSQGLLLLSKCLHALPWPSLPSPGDVTSVTHQGEKDPPSFILTFSLLPKENMMAMANVACVNRDLYSGLFQEEGSQE